MKLKPFEESSWWSRNLISITVIGIAFCQVLLLLTTFFQGVQLSALLHRPAPSLVQMVDGRALNVTAADSNYRTPQLIQQYVQTWGSLTYNWTGKLPNGEADPGVQLDRNRRDKVPTAAWTASFGLTEDFRAAWLHGLVELIPRGIWQGNQEAVFQIEAILPPEKIADGRWKVNIVSNILLFDLNSPIGHPIANNKSIYLRAVPQPVAPLDELATPLLQAVYRLRESGLVIERITEM